MSGKKINFLATVVLAFLSMPGQAVAVDDWSKADTARHAAYLTLHVIDWGQTRYIALHPDRYFEINPLLGEHPTVKTVDNYFLVTAAVSTSVAYLLPHVGRLLPEKYQSAFRVTQWRAAFQYLTIGIEAGLVQHNYRMGIKIAF